MCLFANDEKLSRLSEFPTDMPPLTYLKSGYVQICDPDAIREILVTSPLSYIKSPECASLFEFFNGLAMKEGEAWKFSRKTLSPFFKSSEIYAKKSLIIEVVLENLTVFQANNNGPIDIHNKVSCILIRILSRLLLNKKCEQSSKMLSDTIYSYLAIPSIYTGSCPIHKMAHKLKRKSRQYSMTKMIKFLTTLFNSEDDSLLEMLFAAHKTIDKTIPEITTLLAGVSESSGITTSWLLHCLGEREELQEILYQDIVANKDNYDLPLLENLINEVLRMFPPFCELSRTSTKASVLCGTEFPQGTNFNLSIIGMHRNKKYWNNPLVFDPSRFENFDHSSNFYLPFSAGPRICIGQHLAILQLKIVVIELIKQFKVKSIKIQDDRMLKTLALRTVDPIRAYFIKRS